MKKKLVPILAFVLAVAVVLACVMTVRSSNAARDLKSAQDQVAELEAAGTEQAGQIETLTAAGAEKDAQIETLTAAGEEKDAQIAALTAAGAEKDAQVKALSEAASKHDAQSETLGAENEKLQAACEAKDAEIAALKSELSALEARIGSLKDSMAIMRRDAAKGEETETAEEPETVVPETEESEPETVAPQPDADETDYEAELAEIVAAFEELRLDAEAKDEQIAALKSEISDLEARVDAQKDTIAIMRRDAAKAGEAQSDAEPEAAAPGKELPLIEGTPHEDELNAEQARALADGVMRALVGDRMTEEEIAKLEVYGVLYENFEGEGSRIWYFSYYQPESDFAHGDVLVYFDAHSGAIHYAEYGPAAESNG